MLNFKKSIIFLSIVLTSCGDEAINIPIEDNESLLTQTDSLLSIVDEEFEHIIEENIKHEEEFHTLEDKVKEYENTIKLEQKSHYELINEIKKLRDEKTTQDSLNTIIKSKLELRDYELKNLKEKINYMNIKFKEETVMYESMVFRLEDSLSNLNQKLTTMESFIEENVRRSKIEEYFRNE